MQQVKIILRDREYQVEAGMSLHHALDKVGINRETVLATKNGELITDDIILKEGDIIQLLAVISGG